MSESIYPVSSLDQLNEGEGGLLLVNKPSHWTSFDVVKKVRSSLKIKKVGHAGTLDPLATGLLILCLGKQTKKISYFQELEKVYSGEIVIGKTTPSMDLETFFENEVGYSHITEEAIMKAAKSFLGTIEQVPPVYSAIKVNGARAYAKVRKGDIPEMAARTVTIHEFLIKEISLPKITFEVTCSKGTYIRSLAHDFGQRLGVGAYLHSLCREKIGNYSLEDAHLVEDFINKK